MTKTYSEKDIKRFAGLAGIRQKGAMYVGTMNEEGLWTCFREPADNAADLALMGQNKKIHLIEDSEKNTYWVTDEGDGIPVGKVEVEDERGRKEKLSALYVVTGLTHSGKNFGSDDISRGCFVGNTKVHLENNETKTIEELYTAFIENKDTFDLTVPSFNLETRTEEHAKVTYAQIAKYTSELVRIYFCEFPDYVECTPDHPFFLSRKRGRVEKVVAENLKHNDEFVTLGNRKVTVDYVEHLHLENEVPVYDITVENTHTFFVGRGVLVSNTHGIGIEYEASL